MIKKGILITLCYILWISPVIGAEKKYPPYPEVWGYDLSEYQAVRDNDTLIDVYKMGNGDIWFKFRSEVKRKLLKNGMTKIVEAKYTLLKFFAQERIELSEQAIEKLIAANQGIEIGHVWKEYKTVTFNDGTSFLKEEKFGGRLCKFDNVRQIFLIKQDKGGKEIGKFSILAARPKIEEIEDSSSPDCEVTALKSPIYKQLYFLNGRFIKLEDDTFILFKDTLNLIVRFDKNLNTQFKPQVNYKTRNGKQLTTNLFVIPYSVIEAFEDQAFDEHSSSIAQSLQDKLIDYFINQQN